MKLSNYNNNKKMRENCHDCCHHHTGLPPFKSVMVISAPAANKARSASTSPHTEISTTFIDHFFR